MELLDHRSYQFDKNEVGWFSKLVVMEITALWESQD
jgi:hypothetical protein